MFAGTKPPTLTKMSSLPFCPRRRRRWRPFPRCLRSSRSAHVPNRWPSVPEQQVGRERCEGAHPCRGRCRASRRCRRRQPPSSGHPVEPHLRGDVLESLPLHVVIEPQRLRGWPLADAGLQHLCDRRDEVGHKPGHPSLSVEEPPSWFAAPRCRARRDVRERPAAVVVEQDIGFAEVRQVGPDSRRGRSRPAAPLTNVRTSTPAFCVTSSNVPSPAIMMSRLLARSWPTKRSSSRRCRSRPRPLERCADVHESGLGRHVVNVPSPLLRSSEFRMGPSTARITNRSRCPSLL